MQYHADQVADECVRETGARRISRHARQVALVAILLAPDEPVDIKDYRESIRIECHRRKEYGSIFLIFVLPLLINIISMWVMRWLEKRNRDGQLRRLRAEAFDAL